MSVPTSEQIASDVLLALQLRGQMHEVSVRHILKLACWLTSNGKGKREKCRNWSVGAAERRRSWSNCPIGGEWPPSHGLIHEHIVPRKWIEDALFRLEAPTLEAVQALLNLSEVCLVTEHEDKKFGTSKLKQDVPKGCKLPEHKWLRYEQAGVKRFLGGHPLNEPGA